MDVDHIKIQMTRPFFMKKKDRSLLGLNPLVDYYEKFQLTSGIQRLFK
tara:strand:+ start:6912 stop:7055 length:144 start_codon:yes stop_codon:yes gene_type:complete